MKLQENKKYFKRISLAFLFLSGTSFSAFGFEGLQDQNNGDKGIQRPFRNPFFHNFMSRKANSSRNNGGIFNFPLPHFLKGKFGEQPKESLNENPEKSFTPQSQNIQKKAIKNLEPITYEQSKEIIAPYFDEAFYRQAYSEDLSQTDFLPLEHFMTMGWEKGYNPTDWFNLNLYQKYFPCQGNPFLYWITKKKLARDLEEMKKKELEKDPALRVNSFDYSFSKNHPWVERPEGFYWPEDWGIWASGKARLSLFVPKELCKNSSAASIILDVSSYIHSAQHTVSTSVFNNGKKIRDIFFSNQNNKQSLEIKLDELLIQNQRIILEFLTKGGVSPKKIGTGHDPRTLAIGFTSLKLFSDEVSFNPCSSPPGNNWKLPGWAGRKFYNPTIEKRVFLDKRDMILEKNFKETASNAETLENCISFCSEKNKSELSVDLRNIARQLSTLGKKKLLSPQDLIATLEYCFQSDEEENAEIFVHLNNRLIQAETIKKGVEQKIFFPIPNKADRVDIKINLLSLESNPLQIRYFNLSKNMYSFPVAIEKPVSSLYRSKIKNEISKKIMEFCQNSSNEEKGFTLEIPWMNEDSAVTNSKFQIFDGSLYTDFDDSFFHYGQYGQFFKMFIQTTIKNFQVKNCFFQTFFCDEVERETELSPFFPTFHPNRWKGDERESVICIPGVTFYNIEDYQRLTEDLSRTNTNFKEKMDKVIWKGGHHQLAGFDTLPFMTRPKAVALSWLFPNQLFCSLSKPVESYLVLDEMRRRAEINDCYLNFMNYTSVSKNKMTNNEISNYKYYLCLDGWSGDWDKCGRLAHGFFMNSVCLLPTQYDMHYTCALEPWVHYVPIKNDLSDLLEKYEWLRSHPEEAEEIASNGREFAEECLKPEHLIEDFVFTLNELSKYQKNQPSEPLFPPA